MYVSGPERKVRIAVAFAKIYRTERAWFVCPDCVFFTAYPDDVANSYCGNCHEFKAEFSFQLRCFDPRCPDFGSYDFGEGTCPQEHAIPPAKQRDSRPS